MKNAEESKRRRSKNNEASKKNIKGRWTQMKNTDEEYRWRTQMKYTDEEHRRRTQMKNTDEEHR